MKKLLIFMLMLGAMQATLCPTVIRNLGSYVSGDKLALYFEERNATDQVGLFVSAYSANGVIQLLSKRVAPEGVLRITFTDNGIKLHMPDSTSNIPFDTVS